MKSKAPFPDYHRRINDQLTPLWELRLPRMDESMLFTGVLGWRDPVAASISRRDKASGPWWRALQAWQRWARTAEPASACRFGLEADGGAVEKQGWSLVVATTACAGRQAWQGEQGCAQYRCQSLSKPQIKQAGQSNPAPTGLDSHDSATNLSLTSPLLHCPQFFCAFVVSHFLFTQIYWHDCSFPTANNLPVDFHAIEAVTARCGVTRNPVNEAACNSLLWKLILPVPVAPHSSRTSHFSQICRRQNIEEALG